MISTKALRAIERMGYTGDETVFRTSYKEVHRTRLPHGGWFLVEYAPVGNYSKHIIQKFCIERVQENGMVHKFIIPNSFDGMRLLDITYDDMEDAIIIDAHNAFFRYRYRWYYKEKINDEFKRKNMVVIRTHKIEKGDELYEVFRKLRMRRKRELHNKGE